MKVRLGSRVRQHARLIGGVAAAAVLLTGGGTLAATGEPQARPQATTSGVTLEQAEAFVGVSPTRVFDTRRAGATKFGPGETRTLSLATQVPSAATSVSLAIVSPSGATAISYFTMWPTGQTRPDTSVLNPAPPFDLATSVLLRLGAGHSVDIYNARGEADLVVDLLGYFVPLSEVEGIGGGGAQFLVGSGAPASTLGNDGDVYYDTTGKTFYGPKTGGDWGTGSSATGPTGAQGAVGPQGPAGAAGTDGADGTNGTDGADGSQILSGAGAPATGTGAEGDLYLDTSTGTLYGPKTGGNWGTGTNLTGPQGIQGPQGTQGTQGIQGVPGADGADGSQMLSGTVAPTTEGVDGDFYFDTVTKTLYGPKAGTWPAGTSLQGVQGIQGVQGVQGVTGTAGADGATILSGAVAPTTEGVDGDFYFDTVTKTLYGPKAGTWPAGTSLQGLQGIQGVQGIQGIQGVAGVDGATILSGAVAPTTEGQDGDMYLDTVTGILYGPKTGGVWGSGTDLTGPQGIQGIQGIQGPTGTMGPGTQVYGSGLGVIAILGIGVPVVFDETPRTYGGGVGPYNSGNGQLTLSTAGTYRVSYTAEATAGVAATIAVEVDGTVVAGSESGGLLALSSFNGETLVTVTAGQVLRLTYSALLGVNATLDASMLVEKVG